MKNRLFFRTPYSLHSTETLDIDRHKRFMSSSSAIRLHYGFEKIDPTIEADLLAMPQEHKLFEKMQEIFDGKVVNTIHGYPSENRSVGHMKCRDPFDNFNQTEVKKAILFAKNCPYKHVVVVGIGGSNLGTEAIYVGLSNYSKKREIFFIANIDPRNTEDVLQHVELKQTLFIFCSKSGGTLEIQSNLELMKELYQKMGIEAKKHFVCVTTPKSPMDDSKTFSDIFYMEESVGGRYSVTSMIGVLPLALVYGEEVVTDFLKGAHATDQTLLEKDPKKNPALMDALLAYWNTAVLGAEGTLIAPYAYDLRRLTAHFQQLFMESNGKSVTKEGEFTLKRTQNIVFGGVLTNDQHSYYQAVHQGTFHLDMTVVGFCKSHSKVNIENDQTTLHQKLNANLLAQSIALATGLKTDNPNTTFIGNRSSRILMMESLNAFNLGALLAHFEGRTIFFGFLLGINSFDQEGVQLGKRLAKDVIEKMKSPKKDPLVEHIFNW
ncbi:MAG: glucose-6-phosphate isomerase [Chlamydiae bacterium]|nr:glucose-6-phosphate isomerase [Chlamydiota bacterium]